VAGIVLAVVVTGCLILSTQSRLEQYAEWNADPARHFVDSKPLPTSLDAFYWLRLARELEQGTYGTASVDPLRRYPDGGPRLQPAPLISILVARMAPALDGSVDEAAVYLIAIAAGLLAIPLVLYFREIGLPAVGVLAALLAVFSREYFSRTSIGRLDTDALNLFFPLLASFWVLKAQQAESGRSLYLFSALAGLTMLLFHWWYFHPGFTVVYLVLLTGVLVLARASAKKVAIAASTYAVAANPWFVWKGLLGVRSFLAGYVGIGADPAPAGIEMPRLLGTTTEGQRESILDTLSLVVDAPVVVAIGLTSFAVLAWRRWRQLLPLAPLLVLSLLAFPIGRRFAIFLAPFAGAGLGYLVHAVWQRSGLARIAGPYGATALPVAALVLFLPLGPYSGIGHVPRPALPPPVIRGYQELASALPPASPVLAWWDYGYALTDVGGFATFQDGANLGLPVYLTARALSAPTERELYGVVSLMTRYGRDELPAELEREGGERPLDAVIDRSASIGPAGDVYLLFQEGMIGKYASIHRSGRGTAGTGAVSSEGYQKLDCSSWDGGVIRCAGLTIDTRTGLIDSARSLSEMIVIREGRVLRRTAYDNDTGIYLQVLMGESGAYGFYLLSEGAYTSCFNRMFMLGRYDAARFEEVLNRFPVLRVFAVRQKPDAPS
jgi:dolichyl-diphosphooligosaccharide--protein glycosyltransferase